eukprot:14625478-Ditylum_brightwellii.AAC.2
MYLNDIGVIVVKGIMQTAITQNITVGGEETMLMSYLMTSKLGLESIEETNHTEEKAGNRHCTVYTPGRAQASVSNFIGSYINALKQL